MQNQTPTKKQKLAKSVELANIKFQSVDDFIASGGTVEKLPPVTEYVPQKQASVSSRPPVIELLTLSEADDLWGEDRSRNKTETTDDIVALLTKVVQKNPNFLEQHKIPAQYVELLDEELRDTARLRTKQLRSKIDASFIDPELAALIAQTQPQVLEDIGFSGGADDDDTEPSAD